MEPPVLIATNRTVPAHLHLAVLRLAALLARWSDYRILEYPARWLGRIWPDGGHLVAAPVGAGSFLFDLSDDYWVRLLQPRHVYEPDLDRVFERLRARPSLCFIDAGANRGYWSVFFSGYWRDVTRVIAVEASPSTFKSLVRNARWNGDAFLAVNKAIHSESDLEMTLVTVGGEHAGASLLAGRGVPNRSTQEVREFVRSVRLDDLAEGFPASAEILIKLDVEGVEVEAMKGASRLLASGRALLAYEDHGKDLRCEPSQYLLDAGFHIYGANGNDVRRMHGVGDIRATKQDAWTGYNFFAALPDSPLDKCLAEMKA